MNKDLLINIKKLYRKFEMAIYKIVSTITGKPIHLGYGVTTNNEMMFNRHDIEAAFNDIKQKQMELNVDNIIPFPATDVKKDT